jgi:heptosyltransferase-2
MSLPAIRALRANYRKSEITLLTRGSLADLYARESVIDRVIIHDKGRRQTAKALRAHKFHLGILLPNSFDSALVLRMAGLPQIVGYSTDMRRFLLTHPVSVPSWKKTAHERFYYLEMLQSARLIDAYHHADSPVMLECAASAAEEGRRALGEQGIATPVIGVSPGAAFGSAKCWLPERFAESAASLAKARGGTVMIFGAPGDADNCVAVENALKESATPVVNMAGKTTLRQFIDLAAACSVFLTNDSGAMHVASALSVPTVAVFGSTNPTTTGPAGPYKVVVQEKVKCSPCFKRECPLENHLCMDSVTSARVVEAASGLIRLQS